MLRALCSLHIHSSPYLQSTKHLRVDCYITRVTNTVHRYLNVKAGDWTKREDIWSGMSLKIARRCFVVSLQPVAFRNLSSATSVVSV